VIILIVIAFLFAVKTQDLKESSLDKLMVHGPCKLKGSVKIAVSKNASLPILCATLLNPHPVRLRRLPDLVDIKTTYKLLNHLGVVTRNEGDETIIETSHITSYDADYELVRTMRASILVLGPLLARFGKARVSLPGGCAIGSRPIDIHLMGLEKLGVSHHISGGYVEATTNGLKGAHITLPFASVGATEQLLMAATLASGETVIDNAAREPEVADLANFINAMGGSIEGAGSSVIKITGVKELKSITYTPINDRIEAATFIIAGLMTNSHIRVEDFDPHHLDIVLQNLTKMGAKLSIGPRHVEVLPSGRLKGIKVDTEPYPGFPTDVQAQLMALALLSTGPSVITEHIFENRFMHVQELIRLGAQITLKGNSAHIDSDAKLLGAPVMCTDLRASAALILAALACDGETEIRRIYHLDRGYEHIERKLTALGARIERRSQ
jgi:UDP-N-acetylglucosamine 1-carboxyvinyltransferase